MAVQSKNPIIVQGDNTVLLEVHSPIYTEARDVLARFAELVKSPEHIHTYRITPLSIWNAIAAGMQADEAVEALERYAKYDVPQNVISEIRDYADRYGRVRIEKSEKKDHLLLHVSDEYLAEQIANRKALIPLLKARASKTSFLVFAIHRGKLKLELIKAGWPAEDLAGYVEGEPFALSLLETSKQGRRFQLRDYQSEAVAAFWAGGHAKGGSGTIVMPCGAGKTIIGMGAMEKVKTSTLIITTSVSALRQWVDELKDKTDIDPEQIGEYSGHKKDVKPITVTTYQILTHRKKKDEEFKHFGLFNERDWGLIIYDEVHVLPAPVFSVTADIQARRRLGLTATLVREDNLEEDVFALIGPKKADVPWKQLEKQGWIAPAICSEIRLPLESNLRMDYALAGKREMFRLASENPSKVAIVKALLKKHEGEPTLVIGQYLDQLNEIAQEIDAPIITGKTPQGKRDELYSAFRKGELPVLVVSKVANFAIDLPDARVAIQVSGTFGSRQEEAQRLGRILRPKEDSGKAHFYTLVTRDTIELEFSRHRQLFLTEQGYAYEILDSKQMQS